MCTLQVPVYLFLQEDNVVSCDVTQEANSTMVEVDCSVTSLLLPAGSQVSLSQEICENILH